MDALGKLEYLHFVPTLLQPDARAEEALLRTDVPVPPQQMPIHP